MVKTCGRYASVLTDRDDRGRIAGLRGAEKTGIPGRFRVQDSVSRITVADTGQMLLNFRAEFWPIQVAGRAKFNSVQHLSCPSRIIRWRERDDQSRQPHYQGIFRAFFHD